MIKLNSLPELKIQESELSDYCWLDPHDIELDTLAFDSHKKALKDVMGV
jgi:hypothetical protein